ncbi:MAG: VCBS repeat-containing protein [Rhizobiales bacterium]|nr:VCBS repeat-containing protein [Hyphomicrobiales bacterium]
MTLHRHWLCIFLLAFALLGIAAAASPGAHAATVLVINNDGAGEGFNDPTAAAPVGGNTGTTIGQQRLIAFQRAADIWASRLSSNVTIRVRAQFNPLTCDASSAILGSAGPISVYRDFSGAPVASTWYAVALASALNGSDLDAGDDINATFSSNIGTPGCLSSSGWYYGLDGNTPGNRIDFVSVLLHELGHGLGFLSLVDLASGAKLQGFNDAYMRFLENHGASPPDYPSMTNAQRVAASTSTGNLHWTGANVRAVSGLLTAGAVGDHVRMFAPNPAESGSSVSHWDTVLVPNQVMEPNYTGPLHNPILELPLFKDIGWTVPARLRDFNGNLMSDILWRYGPTGSVVMWLMNGTTVTTSAGIGGDANWTIVGTGDFNGDGKSDILWRNASSGGVVMWLMNGTQVTTSAGIGGDANWTIVGTGDFNGDGKSDILWRNASNGSVVMWQMNGTQATTAAAIGGDANWTIAGTGDFNGDGNSDILWSNTSGGSVVMWLMNGTQATTAAFVGGDANWAIAGTGDFNGDAKSDILWRNASGGGVVMWLMNGTQATTAAFIGGDANWIPIR